MKNMVLNGERQGARATSVLDLAHNRVILNSPHRNSGVKASGVPLLGHGFFPRNNRGRPPVAFRNILSLCETVELGFVNHAFNVTTITLTSHVQVLSTSRACIEDKVREYAAAFEREGQGLSDAAAAASEVRAVPTF